MEATSPLDKPVIPFGNKLMGGSSIVFRVYRKATPAHPEPKVLELNHICWGWCYTKERVRDKLGYPAEKVSHLEYYLNKEQRGAIYCEEYDKAVRTYLRILKEAGVAQYFVHVPSSIKGFEKGAKISTEYPSTMIIGLLEMYRNVHYSPSWVWLVTHLYKVQGLTAAESILVAKCLRVGIKLPAADACYLTRNTKYCTDLFSKKRLIAKIKKEKIVSFQENPDFHGVYEFFMLSKADTTLTRAFLLKWAVLPFIPLTKAETAGETRFPHVNNIDLFSIPNAAIKKMAASFAPPEV